MPRSLKWARFLVTIPAVWIAFVPPMADLNESHIYSPLWSGRARFHTFWLLSSSSLLSLFSIFLLWKSSQAETREGILTAAAIVGALLGGFFSATIFRPIYDGTLSDVEVATVANRQVDPNLFAFSILAILLGAGVVLAWRSAVERGPEHGGR